MAGWKKIITDINTATLTNKTYSNPHLNGAVDGTAIDTDTSLSADSDTIIPSQKAVKAYVDTNSSSISAIGTNETSWTIDKDSTVGKFKLERGDDGTNHTVALKAPTTTANQEITLPDATGTVALCDGPSGFNQTFNSTVNFSNAKAVSFSTATDDCKVIMSQTIPNSTTISGGLRFYGATYTEGDYTALAPIQPTDVRIIELPDDSGTIALTGSASTQNFTGSVQTSKLLVGGLAGARSISIDNTGTGEIKWEGATINDYKTILNVVEPTAAGSDVNTISLPDATGTVMLNLVEDTTPELGGDLNLSGSNIVGNGDILLTPALEDIILLQATYDVTGGKTLKINCTNDHMSGSGYLQLESDAGIWNAGDVGYSRSIVKDEDDMDSDSEHYLATQQSIKAYADKKSIGWHGSETRVKIMPSDFFQNDDYDRGTIEATDVVIGNSFGINVSNSNLEMYASVPIPQGYKATGIKIAGTDTANRVQAYEACVVGCVIIALIDQGIGDPVRYVGTEYDFDTEMTAGVTNYLLVKVTPTSTSDIIYGGYINIEAV